MRSFAILAAALAGCLGSPPNGLPDPGTGDGAADAGASADASPTFDLAPSGTPTSTELFGGPGGGAYGAFCPGDRFVIGLAGAYDGFGLSTVQAICGHFQVVGDSVILVDSVDGEEIVGNTDGGVLEPIACSDGLVAVGFEASENDNEVISHLQLSCAPLTWDGVAVVRDPSELTPELGPPDAFATGSVACDAGMAAGGISGNSGLLIDAFQLDCFSVGASPAE